MKRRGVLIVAILLIAGLLISNGVSVQTFAPPTQEDPLYGATDLSARGAASARTLYVTNFNGNVAGFVLNQAGVPTPLEIVGNVGTVLRMFDTAHLHWPDAALHRLRRRHHLYRSHCRTVDEPNCSARHEEKR